jgi:small subunit ribosomal protein S21
MAEKQDKKSFGQVVYLRDNENINQALRKFKKKVEAAGTLEDLRKKEFYEKPTAVRKRAKSAAKARWRKKLESTKLPKKLY